MKYINEDKAVLFLIIVLPIIIWALIREVRGRKAKAKRVEQNKEDPFVVIAKFDPGHAYNQMVMNEIIMHLGEAGFNATFETFSAAFEALPTYTLKVPLSQAEDAKLKLDEYLAKRA